MITFHFHLQPQYKYELFHINFTLRTKVPKKLQGIFSSWRAVRLVEEAGSQALSTLIRFQTKTELFCSVFASFSSVHTTTPYPFWKHFYTLSAHVLMNSPMRISRYRPAKLAQNICPPFWILTVEWSGARSCLFWWRHRFQIASFSSSTLENGVFKKHRFQIAQLWRAFSNRSVFGDRFWRCSVDDNHIRSKTAPFSFENGLVWMVPKSQSGTLP